MTGRLGRWLPALTVLALLAAACSSDDGDSGAETDDPIESSSAPADTGESSTVAPETTAGSTTTTAPAVSDTEGLAITVTGPGEPGFANTAIQDLDALGYTEDEFFFAGSARSFAGDGFGPDGVWDADIDGQADYGTRLIVRRPADPADFSGVVVVEWLNVTAGADGDPDWGYLHPGLIREGHAYVGVSAQKTGVDTLTERQDGRYAELSHPGDEYSYDIFTQAGVVARGPGDAVSVDVWDGLEPTHVIGAGESQSAFRMTTYANAVHPRAPEVFDGLFIHSRSADPAALGADGSMLENAGGATIRTDLSIPVFTFQTETDVSRLGSAAARQPDTDLLRLWEVAGTAHADAYLLKEVYGLAEGGPGIGVSLNCDAPVNDGPQFEVITAAFHHLVAWVVDGTPPPNAPLIDTTGDDPAEVVRNDEGIATGGIRTPAVDVPAAVLSGEGQSGGGFCGLFGTTLAFDTTELAARYGTPADYVAAVTASADEAAAQGFLLEPEVASIIATAETVEF